MYILSTQAANVLNFCGAEHAAKSGVSYPLPAHPTPWASQPVDGRNVSKVAENRRMNSIGSNLVGGDWLPFFRFSPKYWVSNHPN